MKNVLFLFTVWFVIYACTSTTDKKEENASIIIKTTDAARISQYFFNDSVKTDSAKATSGYFFYDTVSDLQNFEVGTNYKILDEFIAALKENKNTEVIIKKPYCLGDCCRAYKKISDTKSNISVYLFKTDCGEYGFDNDQFLFTGNKLTMVHRFYYHIEEFPTDSMPAIFKIEEKIIDFSSDKALVKERKKLTPPDVSKIKEVDFETTYQNKQTLLQEQTKELKELIELEKLKDE